MSIFSIRIIPIIEHMGICSCPTQINFFIMFTQKVIRYSIQPSIPTKEIRTDEKYNIISHEQLFMQHDIRNIIKRRKLAPIFGTMTIPPKIRRIIFPPISIASKKTSCPKAIRPSFRQLKNH